MPSNRTRKTRTRIGGNEIRSWIRWHTTILQFCSSISVPSKSPWTGESSMEFWQKHKDEIMAVYLEQMREKNRPFQRPSIYMGELAEKHPRLKIGENKRFGPVRPDGGNREIVDDVYELNFQYLRRLGLLEPWEMESKNAK